MERCFPKLLSFGMLRFVILGIILHALRGFSTFVLAP